MQEELDLTPEERHARRVELTKRYKTAHDQQLDIGFELIALSFADCIHALRKKGEVEFGYVLEIKPTDRPEDKIEQGIQRMMELGYSYVRSIGNPDTGHIYVIFQKDQKRP